MLEITDLHTVYYTEGGHRTLPAVRGINLTIEQGTATALVGESGSGKSTAALSVMRLVRPPVGDVVGGRIALDGTELLDLSASAMRNVLLHDIGYVPQDPTVALDPLFTIRSQIAEVCPPGSAADTDQILVGLLERLGVVDAEARLKSYPHEFSGGMRQRVAIAIALAKDPKLVIADEPTTALDVTTQLGILRLLDELRRERGLAVLFVTHDLAVARLMCQDVAVMYGGILVEAGPTEELMTRPRHPYTRALLDADAGTAEPLTRLRAIPGQPPPLHALPSGCPFAPRCPEAEEACNEAVPAVETFGPVQVRCIKADVAPTAAGPEPEEVASR
ncbi:MAG: ABC transporter ATP-binding protein [Acidimicrobiales bacterium]